jgi:hypothetical protein
VERDPCLEEWRFAEDGEVVRDNESVRRRPREMEASAVLRAAVTRGGGRPSAEMANAREVVASESMCSPWTGLARAKFAAMIASKHRRTTAEVASANAESCSTSHAMHDVAPTEVRAANADGHPQTSPQRSRNDNAPERAADAVRIRVSRTRKLSEKQWEEIDVVPTEAAELAQRIMPIRVISRASARAIALIQRIGFL